MMATRVTDFKIDNQDFQHLTIVAKLISKVTKQNRQRFVFSDHTASIEMTLNIDDSGSSSFPDKSRSSDDQVKKYFFVAFTPRPNPDGETKFFVDSMREVTDFNEISKHQSDIIVANL